VHNRFNILICGKIRFADEFRDVISRFMEWKSLGYVDKIVFSGWEEDLSEHRSLVSDIISLGVHVVMSHEPAFTVYGHAFHQIKNLLYGLAQFEENDVILKARTDRVDVSFDPAQLAERFFSSAPVGLPSPFVHRIMIQYATPLQPYFFGDQSFVGFKQDLNKLISFDTWFTAEGAFFNPEQLIHSKPFLKMRPLMRDYFRINPGLISENYENSGRLYKTMMQNSFYVGAIYWGMIDLLNSYILGFTDQNPVDRKWPENLSIEDMLQENSPDHFPAIRTFPLAGVFNTSSSWVIEKILTTPILSSGDERLIDLLASSAWADGGISASVGFPLVHQDARILSEEIWKLSITCRTPYPSLQSGDFAIHYGKEHMIKIA
jgi:hypothetical protein